MTNTLFTPSLLVATLHHVQRHQKHYLQNCNEGQILRYLLEREKRGELVLVEADGQVVGLFLAERMDGYLFVRGVSAETPTARRLLVQKGLAKFSPEYKSFAGYRRGRAKIYSDGVKVVTRLTRN